MNESKTGLFSFSVSYSGKKSQKRQRQLIQHSSSDA